MAAATLPLSGVRVLDLSSGPGAVCGRVLADLGADVILVEPAAGGPARRAEPLVDGLGLGFVTASLNKRSWRSDWSSPAFPVRLAEMVAGADVLVEDNPPGDIRGPAGLDLSEVRRRHPGLVVTSVTEFGRSGPYRDRVATNGVHMALSSVLSRSGVPGRPPVMPPGRLAYEHAGLQAAWATLLALWAARDGGPGDHVDVSVHEAVVASMDAAFGIAGSATGGVPTADLPPGRPDLGHLYPIFPCLDGHVRICLLAARQWRAMFDWLGRPEEFADPIYADIRRRYAARRQLYPLFAALFAAGTRKELVAEGQSRGIPIETVNSAADVLADPHLRARAAWTEVELPSGRAVRVPNGMFEFDGQRAGVRHPLAESGTDEPPAWSARPDGRSGAALSGPGTPSPDSALPLGGLRVLDLGVIVVGAETGRLLADMGAEVLKIESSAFPDGSRAPLGRSGMNGSFAWGHRNKLSFGVDLRSPEGREIFLQLVARSDVVLSNFRPGTLESLGLGPDELRGANPGIVTVESSALGSSGPDSRTMGYGPLVRARAGLTSIWRDPGLPDGFCDAMTVYPDHTAGRAGAVAALALLMARERTGAGGAATIAQTEVMLHQFAPELARESIEPGTLRARGNHGEFDAPQGLYPCAGDDQWVAVAIRGDDDWARLCEAVDAPDLGARPGLASAEGRVGTREEIDGRLAAWTSEHSHSEVTARLQAVGVPAGSMLRPAELLEDAHLAARRFFATLDQPQIGPIPAEAGPARFERMPAAAQHPAPLQGEHTRTVARQVLGLSDDEIDRLVADGTLEEWVPDQPAAAITPRSDGGAR